MAATSSSDWISPSLSLSLFFNNKHRCEESLENERQKTKLFVIPVSSPIFPSFPLPTPPPPIKDHGALKNASELCLQAGSDPRSAHERSVSGRGRHRKSPKTNGDLFPQSVCRRTTSRKWCETHRRDGRASQGPLFLTTHWQNVSITPSEKNQGSKKREKNPYLESECIFYRACINYKQALPAAFMLPPWGSVWLRSGGGETLLGPRAAKLTIIRRPHRPFLLAAEVTHACLSL